MAQQSVLDEELADGLRGAKKSPRNFALICKGTKPVKLIVQKKPIRAGDLNKAKTEFKGNDVTTGVVQGEGAEHVFLVVGDLPSVKTTALKDFISEQSELTCKPRFQAVTELPSIGDAESEGSEGEANELGNTAVVDSQSEASESESAVDGDLGDTGSEEAKQALVAALKALVPTLQQVIVGQPSRRTELLAAVDNVKKLIAVNLNDAQIAFAALAESLRGATGSNEGSASGGESKVSLVKLGKARVEWQGTRDTAGADLRQLKQVIAAEFGDDSEQAGALTAALSTLDTLVAEVENNLHEQLDLILNAEVTARGPLVATAKATIAKLMTTLDTDEVMAEIDDNEFVPGMTVVAPLKKKLQEISAAIG